MMTDSAIKKYLDYVRSPEKALADNLSDRMDPLWDEAMKYVRDAPGDDGGYGFRIRRIARL